MLLSIIIPTYNRLNTLKRTMKSLILQQSDDIEIVVVDDCSNDESISYLESIRVNYINFKVISLTINKGVNFARNRGIENAIGKWVVFLDSDDFMLEDAIQNLKLTLINYNRKYCHFLFPVSYRYDEKSKYSEEKTYIDWLKGDINGDFTHVLKRNHLIKYPFFEEFRAYEINNWLRIFKETTPQLFINKVLINVDLSSTDSLQKQSKLVSREKIIEQFYAVKFKLLLYKEDYLLYAPKIMDKSLTKNILLGISVGFNRECHEQIKLFQSPIKEYFFSLLNRKRFQKVIYFMIRLFVKLK